MRRGLLRFRVAALASAALVGVLSAAAVFSGSPPAVQAAPAALAGSFNECGNVGQAAVASGNTFECDYVSTATAPANSSGRSLQIELTGPQGTTFAASPVTTLPGGCTVLNTSTNKKLNIQCATGAAPGSEFGLSLVGGSHAGAVSMTVSYGKPSNNNPIVDNATFNYQFDAAGGDGLASVVTNATLGGGIQHVTCSNTTAGKQAGDAIAVGDTFDCVVAYNNLVTAGHAVVAPDAGLNIGGFTTSGEDTTGLPGNKQGYLCGSGAGNITCIGYTIHGTATAPGEVVFDQDYYALGAQGHHTDADVHTHIFIVAATTTSLGINPNPVVVNNATTLTATVTPGAGCTLGSDKVRFFVDGTAIGAAAVNSGTGIATLSYTPTTVGSHTIVANTSATTTAAPAATPRR